MTKITPELLNEYFNDRLKGVAYEDTKKCYDALRIHANGEYPATLIDTRRPNEPPECEIYRKAIFEAVTKETVSRIITCLSKIRRSADWSILYDPKTFNASIAENEQPDEYFENKFPYDFTSVTNWLFAVCLKEYLIDSNALCAVIPLNPFPLPNEYFQPFPYVFNSDQVFEYKAGDYCVIKSRDKATYNLDSKTQRHDGDVFWVINAERIVRYEQVNIKKDFSPKLDFEHQLGYMPVFKLGGVFQRSIDTTFIYESRIQPIVPRLNKAIREDNDLDVSVVRHLFPEKWEYANMDCPKCKGVGKLIENGVQVGCDACKETGKVVSSPFQTHVVSAVGLGEQPVPTPPAGYIVKDVAIIQLQDTRIEKHIDKALAAVNMEFLSKTPMNESGTAKEVDKDELNNFVHAIAEDLVAILDKIYRISYDYRYSVRVPNSEDRKAMLPMINVPEKYDMLSVNYLLQEYTSAKTAKMNPVLISKMEEEIAQKKFSTDPGMKNELLAVLKLDPFAGMNSDDKLAASSNGWVTKEDCVISSNIVTFVRRAVFENDDFYSWELDDQQELMLDYANEKIESMSAAKKVGAMVDADIMNQTRDAISSNGTDNNDDNKDEPLTPDAIGKLPLALQQLALAADRADAQGDKALGKLIRQKMRELIPVISADAA